MLLFDGQVHYDTHVIPMGNYVIVFGASAGLHWFQTGHIRQCERPAYVAVSRSCRPRPNVLLAIGLRPRERSLSEMSASLDVDRKTLRKYIAAAAAAGIAIPAEWSTAG
jgi:hypothetical protein